VYFELKKLLKQRVVNFKRSGEGLNNNTIKRMKRRVYELDLKLSELQRKNTRTHEDVENIKANVEQLNAKIFQMNRMIEELKGQLRVQQEFFQGCLNEENTLKSLSSKLQEITNQVVTFSLKDYEEELKYGKFQQSVYFIMYAILFCLIFDVEIKPDDKYEEVKLPQSIQIEKLKIDNVVGFVGEFKKVLNDDGLFKSYILSFKFNKIYIQKNGILVQIIENNDLNKSSCNKIPFDFLYEITFFDLLVRANKFQKYLMKLG
jgi:DNA repair exonuclease SbcCD ATPase subunit